MNLTLCLMSLTWAAGSPPPIYTRYQPIQPVQTIAHTTNTDGQPIASTAPCPCSQSCSCCCRPSLLQRLRCFFSSLLPRISCETCSYRQQCCPTCNGQESHRAEPPQAPARMPTALPERVQAAPEEIVVPTVAYRESTPGDPNQIRKEFERKVGHTDDYSCVTGQLCRVHSDGGLWVVRYAGIDQEDRFGGSVVLAPAVSLKDVREGDLVRVHGEMLGEGRASKHLGGPLYRALTVELIERSGSMQNIPTYQASGGY